MLTKRKKEKKMITDNTKAYVYKITVNSTNKKYIGFHKLKEGEVVSNYIHSSEDAIFQEDFAKGDNTYEIIAEGNATDMATLERDMLLEVDAKNNEEYYNKSNGGGMYVKSVGKKLEIMEVYQLIKNKELKIDLIKKAVIIALARYQTRVENTDMKHVQTLADTMIDLHGNINDFDPIIVLRGYGKNGKDIILDGNHTTLAAKQVSYVVNVPTMYIEKEIWSQFDEVQLVILANLLNPQQEKAAKSGSIDDQVSWIVKSFKKNGVLADSQENIDILKSMNFKTRSINSIIKKAKTKITLNDKLPDGWIWKVWKLYQTELDTIIENASDRDSVAYATSSGKFNFEVALDKLEALMTMKSKKRYMTIFVTHPTWAHMQEFQTKWLPIYKKKIETWIAPKGFNVEIKELDYKIKSSLEDM
jgi:hypothetical protein